MNKFVKFSKDISKYYPKKIVTNLSPASSYRSRCEFGYSKESYVMHDDKSKIYIKSFDIGVKSIQLLMPILLELINNSFEIKNKLFQINFRSNSENNILVTLIYHKNISEDLINKIELIKKKLKVEIIIRAKNQTYPKDNIYLQDLITSKNIKIFQTDNSFYQPNSFLLSKMIDKVKSLVKHPTDLIELYCGVGTFTLPLSKLFKNVFASENDRKSIKCLNKAIIDNNISNIHSARLSATEVDELLKGKNFRRMGEINIKSYDFSHILVDPPRCGLTDEVVKFLKGFENIIYISCNPETYIKDIKLLKDHKIKDIEIFDQFPNTKHLEIVSILSIN